MTIRRFLLGLTFAAVLVSSSMAALTPSSPQALQGVYVGTLGTLAVVLHLESVSAGDDNVYGYYYYRQHGRDIEISGSLKGSVLNLIERQVRDDPRAKIALKSQADGFAGSWTDLKNPKRVLPISLRRFTKADLARLNLPLTPAVTAWQLESPFDALRFDVPFKTLDTARVSGRRVTWILEPKSKVRFPRLPDATQSVNQALLFEHYRLASGALQCPQTDGYTYSTEVRLFSNRLFSLAGREEYDCGGAHPDGGPDNFTLDLETAKALKLEDLYRFTPLPVPKNEDSEAFDAYRAARAKVVKKLILTQYGSFTKNVGAECKDAYQDQDPIGDPFAFLNWYLTPKGLVVQSSFPHVASVCEDDFELPYAAIKAYLTANSPLK
jgi:hypothetical protein